MSSFFKVTYEVSDGYVGGSRPHTFKIRASDVEGMADEELHHVFWEEVQGDFEQKVSPDSKDEEAFVAWAKSLQESDLDSDVEEE